MNLRDAVSDTRGGRLALLASLYLSQGLPFGFFTQALPVFLREADVSLKAIGFSSLLALPWALKFLWAPFIDRGPSMLLSPLGHRRGFILPLQGLAILALIVVALAGDASQLPLVLGAVLFTNFFAATQDIATDGLAVDILRSAERGLGNGIQVAAYRAGMIIGGGALLVVFGSLGWRASFLLMALMLLVATIPIGLMRPREAPLTRVRDVVNASTASIESSAAVPATPTPTRGHRLRVAVRIFITFFSRPGMGAWLVVLIAAKFGDNLATSMVRPALVDAGYTMSDIGWMVGSVGFATSLTGALVGGALVWRLGGTVSLLGFTALQALAVSGYFFIYSTGNESMTLMTTVIAADHFFGGMATAALFTKMMDVCGRENSATDYTLQASVVVFATGAGAACSGLLADAIGFYGYFAVGIAASVACLAVMATALKRAAPAFAMNDDDDDDDRQQVSADSVARATSPE